MTDFFNLQMSPHEIGAISALGLAHLGDAVYELAVRSWQCSKGGVTSKSLHQRTVKYVAAPAQAKALQAIMPSLVDEEIAVYKRGRNAKVNAIPQNADFAQYHAATGLEALFGWLYLSGRHERINELFSIIMEEK